MEVALAGAVKCRYEVNVTAGVTGGRALFGAAVSDQCQDKTRVRAVLVQVWQL